MCGPAAITSHLKALAVFQELHSTIGIAYTHCCLGYANHHLGQASIAAQHFSHALKLADRTGRPDILTPALEGLACVAVVHHAETCARLLGAARQLRQTTGIQLTMIEGHDPAEAEQQARTALGTKGYAAAAAISRRAFLGEILSLATNAGPAGSAP